MNCNGLFTTRRETAPNGDVKVYLERADPVVHVSSVVLKTLARSSVERVMTELIPGPVAGDFTGAILKIFCDDRPVIYRVTGPCEHDCWRLEFPD